MDRHLCVNYERSKDRIRKRYRSALHVAKDVLPYEIVGGYPAKQIKFRFNRQTMTDFLEIAWWEWEPDKILKNSKILLSEPSTKIIKNLKQISKM
jgi:hypothetical protein